MACVTYHALKKKYTLKEMKAAVSLTKLSGRRTETKQCCFCPHSRDQYDIEDCPLSIETEQRVSTLSQQHGYIMMGGNEVATKKTTDSSSSFRFSSFGTAGSLSSRTTPDSLPTTQNNPSSESKLRSSQDIPGNFEEDIEAIHIANTLICFPYDRWTVSPNPDSQLSPESNRPEMPTSDQSKEYPRLPISLPRDQHSTLFGLDDEPNRNKPNIDNVLENASLPSSNITTPLYSHIISVIFDGTVTTPSQVAPDCWDGMTFPDTTEKTAATDRNNGKWLPFLTKLGLAPEKFLRIKVNGIVAQPGTAGRVDGKPPSWNFIIYALIAMSPQGRLKARSAYNLALAWCRRLPAGRQSYQSCRRALTKDSSFILEDNGTNNGNGGWHRLARLDEVGVYENPTE